jgi:hypothetical protein
VNDTFGELSSNQASFWMTVYERGRGHTPDTTLKRVLPPSPVPGIERNTEFEYVHARLAQKSPLPVLRVLKNRWVMCNSAIEFAEAKSPEVNHYECADRALNPMSSCLAYNLLQVRATVSSRSELDQYRQVQPVLILAKIRRPPRNRGA